MLTPFGDDGAMDFDGLDALTDWYLKCGVEGLFAVCASSEMFDLTDDERLAVAQRVRERVGGRVPVFATGTFGGPISEQAEFVRRMSDTGVDGVVIVTGQVAQEKDGTVEWKANVESIIEQTGDIRLGLYECPRPYHLVLDPETLAWCASSGRFDFTKDTSAGMDAIRAKIAVTQGTSLRFYDACAATVFQALKWGGDGFCGVAGNFFADLYVWLCENFADEPDTAAELHRFLSVAERAVGVGYPASAKLFLSRSGLPIRAHCRSKSISFSERDTLILDDLDCMVSDWRRRLNSPLSRA